MDDYRKVIPGAYDSLGLNETCGIIKDQLAKSVSDFVAAGFFIKKIRDNMLYLEKGYTDLWDCALQEFGLNQTAASRCMSFNDRYSIDGSSPEMDQKYMVYNKSQLQEMLYLDQEQLEQVQELKPQEATVSKIREIRKPESEEKPEEQIPGQMNVDDYPGVVPDSVNTLEEQEMNIDEAFIPAADLTDPDDLAEKVLQSLCVEICEINDGIRENDYAWTKTVAVCKQIQTVFEVIGTDYKYYAEAAADKKSVDVMDIGDMDKLDPDILFSFFNNEIATYVYDLHHQNTSCDIATELDDETEEPYEEIEEADQEQETQNIEMDLDQEGDPEVIEAEFRELDTVDQPESHEPLPVLKNNNQREQWISEYKAWGIWYTDQNIGVTYYKYDFENGDRLVAAEYPSQIHTWDKSPYVPVYHHLVKTGHTYNNYANSMTELIEYLKKMQRDG